MTQIARIIYARSHSIGGLLIRHFDNVVTNHWSHSAVLLDGDGFDTVVESRLLGGVMVDLLARFESRYSKTAIVNYEVSDLQAGRDWLDHQLGKRYDYLAVLGRASRQSWQDESAWHCQELTEGFLAACGLRRWRDGPHLITPNAGFSNLCGGTMTLLAEIQADPAGLGYASLTAAQIETAINARNRTRTQSLMLSERGIMERFPGGPMAADAVLSKLEAFAASGAPGSGPVKRALKFLGQAEGLDIGSAATQAQLTALGAAGVITVAEANALKALAEQPCSRAEQLGLPYVTDQMIREAM